MAGPAVKLERLKSYQTITVATYNRLVDEINRLGNLKVRGAGTRMTSGPSGITIHAAGESRAASGYPPLYNLREPYEYSYTDLTYAGHYLGRLQTWTGDGFEDANAVDVICRNVNELASWAFYQGESLGDIKVLAQAIGPAKNNEAGLSIVPVFALNMALVW